jgi:hypothetical protein
MVKPEVKVNSHVQMLLDVSRLRRKEMLKNERNFASLL